MHLLQKGEKILALESQIQKLKKQKEKPTKDKKDGKDGHKGKKSEMKTTPRETCLDEKIHLMKHIKTN